MIVRPGCESLYKAYIEATKSVMNKIDEMVKWVDENDADPESTKAYKLQE
jgi:uncharacterized protein YnzC (UPF0291/DUF896 family)